METGDYYFHFSAHASSIPSFGSITFTLTVNGGSYPPIQESFVPTSDINIQGITRITFISNAFIVIDYTSSTRSTITLSHATFTAIKLPIP